MKQPEGKAEASREAELKIRASLEEKGVLVSSPEDIEGLSSRGYGVSENKKLVLAFYEALFLLGKDILQVEDEKTGKEVSFQDLLKRFQMVEKDAWVKYLIYRDLRSRGYVAREGFGLGIDFRVYEGGVREGNRQVPHIWNSGGSTRFGGGVGTSPKVCSKPEEEAGALGYKQERRGCVLLHLTADLKVKNTEKILGGLKNWQSSGW